MPKLPMLAGTEVQRPVARQDPWYRVVSDHGICIFVNIIISKYLYYMIGSDFLLFTYIFLTQT